MGSDKNIDVENELRRLNKKLFAQENEIKSLNLELEEKKTLISRTKVYLFDLEYDLDNANKEINSLKQQIFYKENDEMTKPYNSQFSKLQSNEYCISCLNEEIKYKNCEIEYLRKDNVVRKILSPLSYIYLILKSKPNELKINLKLLNVMKNSECFDIGYYLNNNEVKNTSLCRYFSPELHYVLEGFDEGYAFNKKYFNRKSKQDLLKYVYTCYKK